MLGLDPGVISPFSRRSRKGTYAHVFGSSRSSGVVTVFAERGATGQQNNTPFIDNGNYRTGNSHVEESIALGVYHI